MTMDLLLIFLSQIAPEYSGPTANFLFKRLDPGNLIPQNKRMDLMGSFVGDNSFQVHDVPHDRVFPGNAHTSQYLPGLSCNI